MALIKRCSCGLEVDSQFKSSQMHGLTMRTCPSCLVRHQVVELSTSEYSKFYSDDYHTSFQDDTTQGPYRDRFEHDRHIAHIRFKEYHKFLTAENTRLLDIGSGNGAFVYEASGRGFESYGLEPGKKAYLDFLGENIVNKTLDECSLEDFGSFGERFGIVVMHDVIEHLVDPVSALRKIRDYLLEDDGLLVVDLPDYYRPEGLHHWRPTQHLWFWNTTQAADMLANESFKIASMTHPIPGKTVFYLGGKSYK